MALSIYFDSELVFSIRN